MTRIITAYFATLVVFAAIDAIWLTQVGPSLYRPVLGDLLAEKPRLGAAVVFYLIFIAGIVYFAVLPGLSLGWQKAMLNGAVLGFVAYATYDLTNQATLAVWATRLTVLDMAWGTFLTAVSATGGTLITGWFFKG